MFLFALGGDYYRKTQVVYMRRSDHGCPAPGFISIASLFQRVRNIEEKDAEHL